MIHEQTKLRMLKWFKTKNKQMKFRPQFTEDYKRGYNEALREASELVELVSSPKEEN